MQTYVKLKSRQELLALQNSPVFTCGPVLSELLQGTRGDHDREAVLEAHRSLEYAEATPAVWTGISGSSPECGFTIRRVFKHYQSPTKRFS